MPKVMIEAVKKMPKRAGKDDCFFVTIDGEDMACFNAEIEDKAGQEVEGEFKRSKNDKKYFKMDGAVDTKPSGGKPAWGGGGKSFGRSPEDLALTAKTMSASYAKDLAVAYLNKSADQLTFGRVLEIFGQSYGSVYGKITGCYPDGTQISQEPSKSVTESSKEIGVIKINPEDITAKKIPQPEQEPGKVECGGANAKLKGKMVSEKFCVVCSFRQKCEVYNPKVPLGEKTQLNSSEKSSGKAPTSSVSRVPAAFILKMSQEQKRIGKEMFHAVLEGYGIKTASEVKGAEAQAAMVKVLESVEAEG